MKPARFDYRAPATLHEAVRIVDDADRFVKVLAGGQSLIPTMNLRLSTPDTLVNLGGISSLADISEDHDALTIGAMVRQQRILESAWAALRCPLLPMAIKHVGHWAIRESGTVAGSIAHADPAGEIPVVAVLLNARITMMSSRGDRHEVARKFFTGPYMTTLADDEIIVSTTWPATPPRAGHAFVEFARRPGDFALSSVAAQLLPGGRGRVTRLTLAMGALTGSPILHETEIHDIEKIGELEKRAIAEQALAGVQPYDDIHATSQDRIEIATKLIVEAITTAARGARNDGVSSDD